MDVIKAIFKNKKVNFDKLITYGFTESPNGFCYAQALSADGFIISINVSQFGDISAQIIDTEMNEPYTLHLAEDAVGSFVGKIKSEYEDILTDIANNCCEPDIFKAEMTKKLIRYVDEKYNDEPEFLWQKFPDNAVVRRKDNKKWYVLFCTVSRRKIGFDSDEKVEIIDIRLTPERIEKEVDSEKFLPGYHMNKKHWITIVLDGSVEFDEICRRIDESYELAKNK
ncbi:MAG: MmcQ/YjbR family DNA-binding protein [Faecalibacterium sp.]|nr:MmcQ/YjbR family DNA-binding protein [Ruminococcus sp.]MCM1391541.1 MmcQ/YjbR family DNA-binding protein [Ruminococcus sp.]MCM1485496.1 MmcQ/YjbR family DNA-binding protein [Faecalibacterium sp.]